MRNYYNKGGPTLTKGTKNFTKRITEKNYCFKNEEEEKNT